VTDDERQRHARSFRGDMAAYARARPGYPRAALDWVLPIGAVDVVDLGAGTGQLTRSLLAGRSRGLRVTAVDPSPGMRAALTASLPGMTVLDGSGEDLPVPDASQDAVLCAQAWHWVDPVRAGAEVARVLRPRGLLGLIWNARDETGRWAAEFGELLRGSGQDAATGRSPTGSVEGDGDPDAGPDAGPLFVLERGPDVPWIQHLEPDGLVDLAASRSHLLVQEEVDRVPVLVAVADLARRWAGSTASGLVELDYVTRSWRGPRTDR